MSPIWHRTRLKSRYVLSILVGLCLGFLSSFLCLPSMTLCDYSLSNNQSVRFHHHFDPFRILNRSARSAGADFALVDYASKDYEPRIHPLPPSDSKSSSNQSLSSSQHGANTNKLIRPRYIADELGIREKVLVAVLTESKRLNTFAILLNQTLHEHVNRLLFFIDEEIDQVPDGMQVLAIFDQRKFLKPFYVFKYLAEKMIQLYDWFLIVPDNTFIRGFKLNEFLNHISINQDLYMGQSFDDIHSVYCFFGSGIILSGTVIQKIFDELDWCTRNAYSADVTDNVGRCISKVTKLSCTDTASNHRFHSYVNHRFEFDRDIEKLSKQENFNQSITIHPVNDLETMLKLQIYFNLVEIDEMTRIVRRYEQTIENLSCYSVEGCGNTAWPVGVPSPFKPPTRFDVLRWDYFNQTHIYAKYDNEVINRMKPIDHEDIDEVIEYATENFRKIYGLKLKFHKLLNGYRQFDPTRGTHYLLDLVLIDDQHVQYIKRAELMRPLGLVEIIPMPFVTETTKIFFILPIYSNEQAVVRRFLQHSNRTIFDRETRGRFELLLTHVVLSKEESTHSQKWFEPIRHDVDLIRQTRTNLVVSYHTLLLPSRTIPRYTLSNYLLEFFEKKLRPNALIFITTPYNDIESDFFNRCRLNVIEKTQIFFPIAFYQYHPTIIARTYSVIKNSTIDLHKSHGWFNAFAFDHLSLYLSDYVNLKQFLHHQNISITTKNLYDLFVEWTNLHILRAPDQSLRIHYRPIECDELTKQRNRKEHHRCRMQQEKGLASREQLAMVIVEEGHKKNVTRTE